MHFSKNECHEFWKNPNEKNHPEKYLMSEATKLRTDFLVNKVEEIEFPKKKSILELGCNIGRNLNALYKSGWKRVSGIDINRNALELAVKNHPFLHSKDLFNEDFEGCLPDLLSKNYGFDLIFSMAVLQHVHEDSIEEVISNVKKLATKYILTIEYEASRVFPYIENYEYEKMICDNDWKQVSTEELDFFGLSGYVFRCFENIDKPF